MMYKQRLLATTILVLLFLPMRSEAGKFVRLGKKEFGKMTVSHPSEAVLRGTTLRTQYKPLIPYPQAEVLGVKLEQALSSEFNKSSTGSADLTMVYTVTRFDPVNTKTSSQNEKRVVKVSEQTKTIFGQQIKTPVMGERDVPVQYFEAHGGLALQVTVTDNKGTVVDVFSPSKDLNVKTVVAVNNESQLKGAMLPTTQSEAEDLIEQVVGAVQARYTRTRKTEDVQLAVDDELRPGNVMAASGNWQGALESWKAATLKSNSADRVFNMAVANEALAYAAYESTRDPSATEPLFQEALRLYAQASKEDPKEKYFTQASSRVVASRDTFAQFKSQEAARQLELEKAINLAKQQQDAQEDKKRREEQELAELNTSRPDSKDEADFRSMVKMRIKGSSERPSDSVEADLETTGIKVYSLNSKASRRVVLQEINRRVNITANREEYKKTFADFASDKVIDKDERDQLRKLSARLGLSDEDTRTIEEPFGAKDTSPVKAQGHTGAPARKATAHPTAAKPAVQNGAAAPTVPAASGPPGAKQP